ncbi:MAG: metal-dependent hydrolase [Chitinophagaceae bacterium]|nr:metal-dependent hydrolase [Chitinophagaceae bacterium]
MDSITHLALGACMGEAFAGKKLGKKAMLWGAIAQSAPDIDFLSAFWLDTPSALLAHRGFTHSFLFFFLITPLFALIAERMHRPHDIRFRQWLLFFGGVIFIHIFIDAFNNYGVGWFEPFSHYRVSFNAIYVADPFFSIWTGIASAALILLNRKSASRTWWWKTALGLSAGYLVFSGVNKVRIDTEVSQLMKEQKIPYTRYFTTPAPLQNWLWFVVAGNDSGYYTGYRSLSDQGAMKWTYFPRDRHLLEPLKDHEGLQKLIRFSKGFYTVEKWGDTLVFNDLRFGQSLGWQHPEGRFAFHYYLQHPGENKLVVQRGRFAGWDRKTIWGLLNRIRGE